MTDHLTDLQVIALRTQSAPAGEAFTFLEHAASCALCSERIISRNEMALEMASLRETLRGSAPHLSLDEMNDLVDGSLLPQEKARMDEHLAACPSCSTHVGELAEMEHPVPACGPPRRRPLAEWISALFTPPRLITGAAAMILLMAMVSGWFLLRHRLGEQQTAALPTPTTAASMAGKIPTETGSSIGVPVDTMEKKNSPAGETRPAQAAGERSALLAITLMPGIVRGEGTGRTVHLPVQLDTLLLTLSSRAELTPGRYQVSLTDPAGHRVWQHEVVYRKSPDAVAVRIPAKLLASGRYVVRLSVAESGGTSESLEEYALAVVR